MVDSAYRERIGDRVRSARRALNLRQSDLSEMTGLPASHLSDIERGVLIPTIPTLQKISGALSRPLIYFLQNEADRRRSMGTVIHLSSIGGQAALRFAQLVEEKTGGEFNLRVYHHSLLGTAAEQVDGLAEGAIDIYIDELSSFERYAPLLGPVCLPYFFRDADHYRRFIESDICEEHVHRALLAHNIRLLRPVATWDSGPWEVLLTREPVFAPEQLAGRRFRSYQSEAAIALRHALGAEPVVVEWAVTPRAFEQGLVDAFLIPASYLESIDLGRFAEYATLIDYGYTINLSVAVNEREYRKLPPDVQTVLAEAASEAGEFCSQRVRESTRQALDRLTEDHGIPVIQPDREAWRAAFDAALRHICVEEGLLSREMYDALQSL